MNINIAANNYYISQQLKTGDAATMFCAISWKHAATFLEPLAHHVTGKSPQCMSEPVTASTCEHLPGILCVYDSRFNPPVVVDIVACVV